MENKIKTTIKCPNCDTELDFKDIKIAIQNKINDAINEVNKSI